MAEKQMENPVKLKKAKGMVAPFAFLSSILLYVSIFYIFSFSPSTLFNDNKFWFVISNTLILIIAADYGAFSSSKHQKRDVYEEYALHSQGQATRRTSAAAATDASFVSQHPEIAKKSLPMEEETTSEHKYKEGDHVTQTNNEIPEKILEVLEIEPRTDNSQANISTEAQEVAAPAPMKALSANGTSHQQVINNMKTEPRTIRRSKSDKVKHVKALNDKSKTKGVLHRSKTEKQHEEQHVRQSATADEFSSMSNEELNRRVEEFIKRFNREIRLEGVRNLQVLEYE